MSQDKPKAPPGVHSLVWQRLDDLELQQLTRDNQQAVLERQFARYCSGARLPDEPFDAVAAVKLLIVELAQETEARVAELRARLDALESQATRKESEVQVGDLVGRFTDQQLEMARISATDIPERAAPPQPKGRRQL